MRTAILAALTALLATGLTGAFTAAGEDENPPKSAPAAEEAPAEVPEGGKPESDAAESDAAEDLAPDFEGENLDGETVKLSGHAGKWVVLEWINHGCPFVKKHYDAGTMQALQKKYTEKGVVWITICSSAPGKQGHMTTEEWKKVQAAKGARPTEVVLDPEGRIGRLYEAGRTPHMVVLDPKRRFVYEGAIDDRPRAFTPEKIKGALNYVSSVLDAVLEGEVSPHRSTAAYGCTVKYAD
jgi:peroxiredoxin